MSKLVENLKKLDEQMQIELLRDYLVEAQQDGRWTEAHSIKARLAELYSANPEAANAADHEKDQACAREDQRRANQYKHSFVARGID